MSVANYPSPIIERIILNEYPDPIVIPLVGNQTNICLTAAGASKFLTLPSGVWALNANGIVSFVNGCTGCEVMFASINRTDVVGRQSATPICLGVGDVFTDNTIMPFAVADFVLVPPGEVRTFSLTIGYTNLTGAPAYATATSLYASRLGDYPDTRQTF